MLYWNFYEGPEEKRKIIRNNRYTSQDTNRVPQQYSSRLLPLRHSGQSNDVFCWTSGQTGAATQYFTAENNIYGEDLYCFSTKSSMQHLHLLFQNFTGTGCEWNSCLYYFHRKKSWPCIYLKRHTDLRESEVTAPRIRNVVTRHRGMVNLAILLTETVEI